MGNAVSCMKKSNATVGNVPLPTQESALAPPIIFPGQKHHFTCGVVVTKAYWNCALPQSQPLPGPNQHQAQRQPNAQLEALSVGVQQAINRKRKAALEKGETRRVAAMLKAPMCRRKTEGEVLFAIGEMIGHPETWKEYLSEIFWSRHWGYQNLVKMACFLAHNGLPHHLALQWMGARGVLCNKREFEIAWHKTLQGEWSDNAFTWDLIDGNGKGKYRGKYCCLNNGQERCIPDDKCNKPQQGSR